jgi:RimJ/RimL family protein N-acetyltransferase
MIRLDARIPGRAREWRNDPSIMQYCRQNELISEAKQEAWEKRILDDPSIKMFTIESDDPEINRIPLGVCGFTSISMIHRHAEFSLYIAPEFNGKGYGREALLELLKYGFHNLGLNRTWGEVFEGNPALSMFLSVGFEKEGRCRQSYFKSGKFIDSTIISILRSEYDSRYSNPNHSTDVPLSLQTMEHPQARSSSKGTQ